MTGACSTCAASPDDVVEVRVGASTIGVGDATFAAGDVVGAVESMRRGAGTAARFVVDDGVPFERVARLMDRAKGAGFTSQSLEAVPSR
jgi:hypothetical protein